MNIAMEQTEEYVNGQLKKKYGDCFIRGNNGEAVKGRAKKLDLSAVTWLPVHVMRALITTPRGGRSWILLLLKDCQPPS